jgi:hypothetical protein
MGIQYLITFFIIVCLAACATSSFPGPEVSEVSKNSVVPQSWMVPKMDIRAELSSNDVAAGTIVLVTLRINSETSRDQTTSTITGDFEGASFPFFTSVDLGTQTYEGVLGIPYERKPGAGFILIRQKDQQLKIPVNIVDGNYPSETLHVDGRRVNPTKKKDLIRIKKEMQEVAEIYKRLTPQKYWSGHFDYPIQSTVTSAFGTKRIYNGSLKNYHPGLDLRAPIGTPIYSAAPGQIVLAKNLFYTGNTVMIDHGYGVVTLYAHMTELKVKTGDLVGKHDLLGLSGKTGRVSGPHLHWQAVVNHVKVNPIGLTEVMR